MLNFLTTTKPTWATLPLRIALGIIFLAHGAQKVFGAFGGAGFDNWINTPVQITLPANLPSIKFWLACAAFAELVGGGLVLFGFATRVGALLLGVVMSVALYFVHWRYGFFLRDGGVEYVFALWCMCIALVIEGGGRASVDSTLN
jgi:putative oxidoreductase